ncbi:hypothetical protein OGH69_16270 [Flavobacterium sp. MFBS3-15]|uniref:hypothetical protein n=1 Tax=Flavobacterium sp. MFBS3-15 TaxID=2989816 RepID=UPI002236037C|nr:hypothetical protein [Flavobacterium sp. MFBS3-15]MCW4470528.1 hypothetical protein [Flavobacterium sp. MFBS3-15]
MRKKIFFFFVFVSAIGMQGQELVKCSRGKTFWSIPALGKNYTLQLAGNAEKANHERLITVDGKNLQFLVADKKAHVENAKSEDDLKVLVSFVRGESSYIISRLMVTMEIRSEAVTLSNGKKAILWSYQMPDGHNDQVTMQHYINVIEGDMIFGLASADFEGDDPEKTRQMLVDILGTLISVKDPKKLCDQ